MSLWLNLQKREKLVVFWGGAFLLLFLGYVLVVSPLRSDLGTMEATIARQQDELIWMQAAAVKARQLTALRSNKSAVSPLKVIDQAAREFGIASSLTRVDPGEAGKIKVWFENLIFVDFMKFLRDVGSGRGLALTSLSVESLDAPGIVNARVTFKAGSK